MTAQTIRDTQIVNRTRSFWRLAVFLLIGALGCDKDSEAPEQKSATGDNPATAPKKHAQQEQSADNKGVELAFKPDALPTETLDARAFLEDPCTFASAEQVGAFLVFADGETSVKAGESLSRRPECVYRGEAPPTRLKIRFDRPVQKRSSEEELELAGLPGVRLRLLTKSADLKIPFEAARDRTKVPASLIRVRLNVHEGRLNVPIEERPTKESMKALMLEIGKNLIARLDLAKK